MGLLLFIVFVGISAWGVLSVQAEIARKRPHIPFNDLSNRLRVAIDVWDRDFPRRLKRRYLLTGFCFPLAMLSIAQFVANHAPESEHNRTGILLAIVLALATTVMLLFKLIRHGW